MVSRIFLFFILGGQAYSLTVPRAVTVTITRSKGVSVHHRHLIIRKQTTNPNDEPPNQSKFNRTRQKNRSADFPPLTYADTLLDLPFEPEISFILKANRATRLVEDRSYARRESFEGENITNRPTLEDLSSPQPNTTSKLWISASYRLGVGVLAYVAFPPLTRVLEGMVTVTPDLLNELSRTFAPGISILYGTFISLTLSILYDRIKNIQGSVAKETSLLSLMAQNILTIFRDDEERVVRGGQCIADQIRILVKESRGRELMSVIYSDPYLRMLELIAEKEEEIFVENGAGGLGARAGTIATARDTIKDMMEIRSERLGQEALALPPTHFLILLGFTISTFPDVASTGNPSNESSILFSVLCSVYVLFFNFANDLNNPFMGVYQVRRSSAASHLLQTKWLIANHPSMRGKVDFEDVTGDIRDIMEREDLSVWTPGLGSMMLSDSCEASSVE